MYERTTPSIPQHIDYERNLSWVAKFVKNYNDTHSDREMSVKLRSCLDNLHYFVEFAFTVPVWEGMHNAYANPVNPNNDWDNFFKEFKATYFAYHKFQRNWNAKKKTNKDFQYFTP